MVGGAVFVSSGSARSEHHTFSFHLQIDIRSGKHSEILDVVSAFLAIQRKKSILLKPPGGLIATSKVRSVRN